MKSFHSYKVTSEHNDLTIENYLKEVLQYSGRKIQKLTRKKGILLNSKSVFLQKKLKSGDTVKVLCLEDVSYGVQSQAGPLEILYEDEHLFILNKPANLLVHPTGQTTEGTLANFLAYELEKRQIMMTVRPLHRLDRNTSGCVVFTKDSQSQTLLEKQLQAGRLKRTYKALVKGVLHPLNGTIDAPIGPHPTLPNRRAVSAQGETALTHYKTLQAFGEASLIEVTLETGRTHQIRVHLAHIGHPLFGDSMYGQKVPWLKRQFLHASALTFEHLTDHRIVTVDCPLPDDLQAALFFCQNNVRS